MCSIISPKARRSWNRMDSSFQTIWADDSRWQKLDQNNIQRNVCWKFKKICGLYNYSIPAIIWVNLFAKFTKNLSFGFGGKEFPKIMIPTLPPLPQQGSAQQGHGVCLDRPQNVGQRSWFSSHGFFFREPYIMIGPGRYKTRHLDFAWNGHWNSRWTWNLSTIFLQCRGCTVKASFPSFFGPSYVAKWGLFFVSQPWRWFPVGP